ncbi:hypothetical protein K2X83_02925 [Patescibacteria group bacterium]|nr:hypothetical protein [Patescibacteria group bacterium]
MKQEGPLGNRILRRLVDPTTVRPTPAARAVIEQIVANATLIDEHRRQTDKSTMDAGEDHFSTQRHHLTEFFRLGREQEKLARRFDSLEARALLVQLGRNILGIGSQEDSPVR